MALTFPGASPDGIVSLRVYHTGALTGSYAGNQFVFALPTDVDAQAYSKGIRLTVTVGGSLTYSFDGTTDHGKLVGGTIEQGSVVFNDRYEGGIALKGSGTFTLEAW